MTGKQILPHDLARRRDRILFGTDFPMAPALVIDSSIHGLDQQAIGDLSTPDIYRRNAARLLNRN